MLWRREKRLSLRIKESNIIRDPEAISFSKFSSNSDDDDDDNSKFDDEFSLLWLCCCFCGSSFCSAFVFDEMF